MIKVSHLPAIKQITLTENPAQASHFRYYIPKCWKPPAGVLNASTRETKLGCYQTDKII